MQLYLITGVCSAFAFVLGLIIFRYIHRETLYVKTRIKNLFSTQTSEESRRKAGKKNKNSNKNLLLLSGKVIRRLNTELSLAGIHLRAEEFIIIWAISAFVPAGFTLLLRIDWLVSFGFVIVGSVLPVIFVRRSKAKRLALFEKQLSDALMIMGNCLRTGLSFQQAITSISIDMPEPISKEFARVSKEVQLGVTLERALENMVERLESKDFMLIVAAVLIQRQVGGNLSEILDGISDTIRERLKIKASIRVLTATGRVSGIVVGLMPVFITLALMLINPPYIRSFFESTLGIIMLCTAGGLELIGYLAVKKAVTIKF